MVQESLGVHRPFQGVHDIKTTFMFILKSYVSFKLILSKVQEGEFQKLQEV